MDRVKRQGGGVETHGTPGIPGIPGTPGASGATRASDRAAAAATSQGELPTVVDEVNDAAREMMPWMASVLAHVTVAVLVAIMVPVIMAYQPPPPLKVVVGGFSGDRREALGGGEQAELARGANQRALETVPIDASAKNSPDIIGVVGTDAFNPTVQTILSGHDGSASTPDGLGPLTGNTRGTGTIFHKGPGPGGVKPTRIAYVIDASGSLATDLDIVLKELRESIRDLDEDQSFTVVFFQRDVAIEVEPRGMKKASEANKLKVQAWLDPSSGRIVPGGSSSPLKALRQAMRYKPEQLYILSDNITGRGPYELDREALLTELEHLNPAKATRIDTIQFLYPDPLHTLEDIAAAHGGQCRFIQQADVWLTRSAAQPVMEGARASPTRAR